MFDHELNQITETLTTHLAALGIANAGEVKWQPTPFAGQWGLGTNICFQAAAAEARSGKKVNVPQRAQELAKLVAENIPLPAGFARLEADKAYINVYFDTAAFAARVVDTAIAEGAAFGKGAPKGERVMVEFSQPNTHKAFHVGHLRSAILGDALARIVEFAGYDVVRANYPGDMGLHVIRWLWNYLKHHNGEEPTTDITQWMGSVYADATRRLEEKPELEQEVRAVYARWDQCDPEIVALWQKTRQWSLDGFSQLYAVLGIRFDKYYFNSEEEAPGKAIVAELIQRGLAIDERPEGAVIVKLDELLGSTGDKYRVLVVLRSDGTALYATEDLALVLHKFRDYPDLARAIYVVDVRQSLHFTQVFKTMELAGHAEAKRCTHIAYELVTLPGNVVMSSREGTVVLLEDLIREATTRAKEETRKKNPALTEEQLDAVARAVGLGALKYPLLARENAKVVTFDWQSALDFNGQAAPYIQYAHVRCNSILRKAQADPAQLPSASFSTALAPAEIALVDWLSRFTAEVQRAAAEYKPLVLTSYAYELARAFTTFYDQCPVMQAAPEVRAARLRLVAATRQTLANALNVLGIEAPEVM